MDIKPLDYVVDKWDRHVAIAGPDYEHGIKNPRRDWQAATEAAEDSWKTALAAAIAAHSWPAGVRRVGTSGWQEKAISKGLPRWSPGVAIARPDYERGFEPYHAALARGVLPPRYAKGDARNYARVKYIGDLLHKLRLARRR